MTDPFQSDEIEEAPTSEPSTIITTVSPATEGHAEASALGDRTLASPIGDAMVAAPAARDVPAVTGPEPGTAKRVRPKMTLRIPDDEVARPSKVVPSAPSPAPSSTSPNPAPVAAAPVAQGTPAGSPPPPAVAPPAIVAQRIISLKVDTPTNQIPASARAASPPKSPAPLPPVVAPPPREVTSPGIVPRAPPSAPDEDSWTPYQPVAADREPSDAGDSVDIPIESGPFDQEPSASEVAEPAREVAQVAPAASSSPIAAKVEPSPAAAPPAAPKQGGDSIPDISFDEDGGAVALPARDASDGDRVTLPRLPDPRDLASPPAAVSPVTAPPVRARRDAMLDADEISVESDRISTEPAEIAPEDVVSVEAVPRTAPASTPAPPMRPRATSSPGFPAVPPLGMKVGRTSSPGFPTTTIKTSVAPEHLPAPPAPPPKPRPIVIVPNASPLAPPPMSDAASSARKRARPWWEELFNDDFIRTMAKITDPQIAKEVDFIEDSLALDRGAMVLDLACGTGRHAIELTRRGYQVVGFDLSLAMLAKAADEAQDRNQKINFVQGDMREMTFEETFDGVYCWSTSFGFFEEEKNSAVIANVRRALKPGGQLLLDVVTRDFVAQQCPSLVWFEGDGCVCMDDMTIDWITSRMKIKRTMMMDDGRSREIEYSIRIYALHELGKLLHENGFRVSQVSGRIATPGVFFGADSPQTFILAEKK